MALPKVPVPPVTTMLVIGLPPRQPSILGEALCLDSEVSTDEGSSGDG